MRRALMMASVVLGTVAGIGSAQEKGAPAPAPGPRVATAPAGQVAATVNGQPIPEVAVQRGLKRVPPNMQAEARAEILKVLIDNALVDQYLNRLKVAVDNKDVDAKVKQVQEEIKKEGSTFDKVMQDLLLTEADLRAQI